MAANTPITEPTALIAGDTAKWLKSLVDYSASDGWALSYTLINATAKIAFSATASGSDFLVDVSAATTSAWTAGSYAWRSQVSRSGEVYTIGAGTIIVQPSFGVATLDNRSFARTALANIEAYLQNSSNLSSAMYEIAGRKLQRIPVSDLLALRDRYKSEVAREDGAANSAAGLPDRRRVMVRFGP